MYFHSYFEFKCLALVTLGEAILGSVSGETRESKLSGGWLRETNNLTWDSICGQFQIFQILFLLIFLRISRVNQMSVPDVLWLWKWSIIITSWKAEKPFYVLNCVLDVLWCGQAWQIQANLSTSQLFIFWQGLSNRENAKLYIFNFDDFEKTAKDTIKAF